MRRSLATLATLTLLATLPAGGAEARGLGPVAALQVALRAHDRYAGTVDGFAGPLTRSGVRAFQRRHGLRADGLAGTRTRRALGRLGRHPYGSRPLRPGAVGWDVSTLQFLLAWHGFPNASLDGGFGAHVERALLHFQRRAGLTADGVAGPVTLRALRGPLPRCPLTLARPVPGGIGDTFGPRGDAFHPGLDFPEPSGVRVRAARAGRVVFAGHDSGGYGNLVEVADGDGVVTLYAHLSRIGVRRGTYVATGSVVGRVGATGLATGPHLHFEVRVRGAAVDPRPAFR
jgi:murein DD-endopeptidase MepM/ murein hydrolase activator NlpD